MGLKRRWGLQKIEALRLRQSEYEVGKFVSLTHGPLPTEIFLVLISVRG